MQIPFIVILNRGCSTKCVAGVCFGFQTVSSQELSSSTVSLLSEPGFEKSPLSKEDSSMFQGDSSATMLLFGGYCLVYSMQDLVVIYFKFFL